ncbi:MAG: type II toxin-antitoxin system VapC family toxin [Gammaproteobacteria bacterium]
MVSLLDTGPLVAALDARDTYHDWAREQFANTTPPFLTCEAVISEACHLTKRAGGDSETVLRLVDLGVVAVPFHFNDHVDAVRKLMRKYNDLPASFADACLVRMAEIWDNATLVTMDSDFLTLRKHGRQRIPVTLPILS